MTVPAFRGALLASIALVPAPLLAQETMGGDDPVSTTTIVVTAQKIEQRAQDVPITISAVTGERIEDLGVSDLDELSSYVPGLNIQEQSANNPGIVIRGITSDSGSSQQGPRVTLYYNGVDISRSRGSYQAIYDLERVEEGLAVIDLQGRQTRVQRDQPQALQRLRHLTGDDALSQQFRNGGLTHSWSADQHRIVLAAPREHLDQIANLAIAADDGIELPGFRFSGEIPAIALERCWGRGRELRLRSQLRR